MDGSFAAFARAEPKMTKRWLVHTAKSLLIIQDQPDFADQRSSEIQFLGIACKTGAAREGKDTPDGFKQKLVSLSASVSEPLACLAVLGILTFNQDLFLLVVTAAEPVVDGEQSVHLIRKCDAIPAGECTSEGVDAAATVTRLLEEHFYFSHKADITRRLQQRVETDTSPSLLSADPRYVWNLNLCEPLLGQGVTQRWFTPVMQGFIQQKELRSGAGARLLLIARRSRFHAGTRYNARGLDDDAEAANWVESEMLARLPGRAERWLSLTQVRGSAPVYWEQKSTSDVTVTRGTKLVALGFKKHQAWIRQEYGNVFLVSLLSRAASKRDTEGLLSAALAHYSRLSGEDLAHLDFHARVTGEEDAFSRELDSIYDEVATKIAGFGFFEVDMTSGQELRVLQRQQGVVRTNCFDSLDRTNLLQYQVTWRWLKNEWPKLQDSASSASGYNGKAFADAQPLQGLLRSMWADLGDALSEQYTGTASTMGAALRQGGHTARAMLEKGWRAVNRAYCAHFEDDARQSALQLLLRHHKLVKAPGLPEIRRSPQGKLRLALATWNLHGRSPWESAETLQSLVRGACEAVPEPPDVFVFCFQEFSELSATNVVLLTSGDEVRQARFETAAAAALRQELGETFWELRSLGMVGLYVSVFVAERLAASVNSVHAERIRSGLYGQAGNKGAVAVSFKIEETAVCAVSLHLESGQQTKKAQERLEQLREILQGVRSEEKGKFDVMVLGGDFNFRASFPENLGQIPRALSAGWVGTGGAQRVGEGSTQTSDEVLGLFREFDEVTAASSRSRQELQELLKEFSLVEGPVRFPPTYRLKEGQSAYDLERQPAWCDRVLHSRVSVVRKSYCALGHLTQTDHRPVCAMLELLLLAVPRPGASPARTPSGPSSPADLLSGSQAGPFGLPHNPSEPANSPASNEAAASKTATPTTVAQEDLLDLGDPPDVPSSPVTPMQIPQSLQTGQLVLAKFQTGWYFANVMRYDGSMADVAWLRPQGSVWGNKAEMSHYLCSTGADETLHGENLLVATHIRLPDELRSQKGLHPSVSPTNSVDLLG